MSKTVYCSNSKERTYNKKISSAIRNARYYGLIKRPVNVDASKRFKRPPYSMWEDDSSN